MQFYLVVSYCLTVSIYLVACEQAVLGGGGGREKEDPPPQSLLAGYLFGGIGDAGGYHC